MAFKIIEDIENRIISWEVFDSQNINECHDHHKNFRQT